MPAQTIVIGLDGFEPTIAHSLIEQGKLPFIDRLFGESALYELDHSDARYTGLAWEHFSTGLSPDAINRWSAVSFDTAAYAVTQKQSRHTPFTTGLTKQVLAFDIPYHELSCSDVTGVASWGAHDPGIHAHSNPVDLAAEILARFGPYPASEFIYAFVWPDADRTAEMANKLQDALSLRFDIFEWLMCERLPGRELAIVVASEFHSALEALWHGWDATHPLHRVHSGVPARQGIIALYELLDARLSRLSQHFPDATLCLFAPHGMGANHGDLPSMALLPELMYRDAFGTPLMRPDPSWNSVQTPDLTFPTDWSQSVLPCFAKHLSPNGSRKLSSGLSRLFRKFGLHKIQGVDPAIGELKLDWMPATRYREFWPKMRAFALPSFYDGRIRINLENREAHGIVRSEDYHSELDRIETLIWQTTDGETGQPAISRILRPSSSSPRAAADSQCDLQVIWSRTGSCLSHPKYGLLGPLPYRRTGGHTGNHGLAVFHNSALPAGRHGVRSTFDFVPTLLDVLGTPAGANRVVSGQSILAG